MTLIKDVLSVFSKFMKKIFERGVWKGLPGILLLAFLSFTKKTTRMG